MVVLGFQMLLKALYLSKQLSQLSLCDLALNKLLCVSKTENWARFQNIQPLKYMVSSGKQTCRLISLKLKCFVFWFRYVSLRIKIYLHSLELRLLDP